MYIYERPLPQNTRYTFCHKFIYLSNMIAKNPIHPSMASMASAVTANPIILFFLRYFYKHLTRLSQCSRLGVMYSFVKDQDGEVIATTKCLDCQVHGIELHSRGLCMNCYQANRRAGTLADFPTAFFLNSPEEYVAWAVKYLPELVQREAKDQGVEWVKDW